MYGFVKKLTSRKSDAVPLEQFGHWAMNCRTYSPGIEDMVSELKGGSLKSEKYMVVINKIRIQFMIDTTRQRRL